MSAREIDLAIVGGGLAGGLIALAVHRAQPQMSLALFEAGEQLGGNHRWSWFGADLSAAGTALLDPFAKAQWSDGNEVRFPAYTRRLSADYRSLDSRDFDAALQRLLPAGSIHTATPVATLAADGVTTAAGETWRARAVIDCRNGAPGGHLRGGWQVFLGQNLATAAPHGLDRPIIMDATVDQIGGYRFVYVLPLAPSEVFVEDTYYVDSHAFDAPGRGATATGRAPSRGALRARIAEYAAARGWEIRVLHEEHGTLPVITGGDFAAHRKRHEIQGVALAGARGGFVHPLTSYTLPIAVDNALAIARHCALPGHRLADFVADRAHAHWRATAYYRLLGKMLFDAAEPEQRYRIFQRFYRLPEPLIERFYAARSTSLDKARILTGRPPVPVSRAVKALLGNGAPLVQGQQP
ncbi:MAG: lycopene cyclase [Citromicrobium sp.]|nr:MAG: lycopene cyclase [Citromicrobium sp.]